MICCFQTIAFEEILVCFRNVCGRIINSDFTLKIFLCLWCLLILSILNWNVEVNNFNSCLCKVHIKKTVDGLKRQKYILWIKVPMYYFVLVHVLNCDHKLFYEPLWIFLG